MSVIPQVKCRRCGESFSALRSRCPNCGTRRVSQSGRTPAPTPSTVKGTAAYERAETNTRWQMIFGLILVVAVILAVIVMVSTSLSGLDNQSGKGSNNTIVATPTPTVNLAPTVEPPPTPTPTPTPTVEGINIQCFGTDVKEEFTLSLSRDAAGIELQATVLPMEVFTTENTRITWKSSDESLFMVTPSEDTRKCKVEILQTSATPAALTVTCNDYSVVLVVRLVS